MRWVSPFGHFRVKACCQLTGTFRRLPRPSSPLTAKASTVCAYSLDHITPSRLGIHVSLRLLASTTRLVRQNQNACLRPKFSKNTMRTATSHRIKAIDVCDPEEWWVWEDSNHRPHPYQGCALTT